MNARLPIYKSLSQRIEVLGLSLWEIGFLVGFFVMWSELLTFIPWRTFLAFVLTALLAGLLRHLNRRFERNFLLRLVRFIMLPSQLSRQLNIPIKATQDAEHAKATKS